MGRLGRWSRVRGFRDEPETHRKSPRSPRAVAELNSPAVDQMPNVSSDGTEVVFASSRGGNMDIWTATFDGSTGLSSSPVPVAAVNTAEPETRPSLSGDGSRLYFGRGATADGYVSARVEIEN